jgi:TetR/AcrR family transcriptional regulator, mexCD-oprJ operon repressor
MAYGRQINPEPGPSAVVNSSREPQRADSRFNRDTIIEAAIRILGYDARASMATIAEAAGVNRSTIYRRFPSRAALIDELTDAVAADFIEVIADSLAGSGTYSEVLAGVLRRSTMLADRYHFLNLHEVPMDDTAARESWLGLLQAGQSAGEFRPDFPVVWLSSIARALNLEAIKLVQRGALTLDEAADYTVDAVLGAVRPPPAT